MRAPEEVTRDLVRQWVLKAEEDFGVAKYLVAENTPYLRAVGFHAQQAAEKLLKALLVRHQIEFPKTHNLGELLDLVASVDRHLAESLWDVTALNPYAVYM
jgi:HEPN domain-containing protein